MDESGNNEYECSKLPALEKFKSAFLPFSSFLSFRKVPHLFLKDKKDKGGAFYLLFRVLLKFFSREFLLRRII
ncbi:hypothetical protein DB41_IB00360 [Neochlamydia sp. TUME1]|nr:hypothetical protein DB41_IB00360 [Neochlamydia sp. TUME1]